MSSSKGLQYHDIPMIVNGQALIVKGVRKFTTCDDVISKWFQNGASLAIFMTTSWSEKELSGKTKLLKVWRSHGSSKKTVFVVKKSEGKRTSRRFSLNIFASRNNHNSLGPAPKAKRTPNSSINSVDAFHGKADHQKLGKFLGFCSGVTAARHPREISRSQQLELKTPRPKLDRAVIKDSLKTMKLGFKKTLTSKFAFDSKTTSVSTLESTDTGYQSQTSDMRSEAETQPGRRAKLETVKDVPLHSTPVTHTLKRRRMTADDTFDVTLTTHKAPKFDEVEGKSVLMERFMNDTTISKVTKRNRLADSGKVDRSDRDIYSSAPVLFSSQEEKCRFYWDQNCDSDSDTSCSDDDSIVSEANLDEAFVEYCDNVDDFSEPSSRKLRRESAVTNLNRSEICAELFEDTCYNDETKSSGFDYSFDCSFPEFSDTQDFSVDYSCSETESDLSISFEEGYFRPVKDSDIYSFMKSRESLAINEKSRYRARDSETQSENGSDEGLGSMTSDSFVAEQEIFL